MIEENKQQPEDHNEEVEAAVEETPVSNIPPGEAPIADCDCSCECNETTPEQLAADASEEAETSACKCDCDCGGGESCECDCDDDSQDCGCDCKCNDEPNVDDDASAEEIDCGCDCDCTGGELCDDAAPTIETTPAAEETSPEEAAAQETSPEEASAEVDGEPVSDVDTREATINVEELKPILEALLFATEEPLTARRMADAIDEANTGIVRVALADMRADYDREKRGFGLEEIAGGYQLLSRVSYGPYLEKLQKKQSRAKLSAAALETLAIIAYKQPIGRADIEAIRGVQAGPILRMLMDRGMVKIAGREEVIGRPFLYGTTKRFLEHFGLKNLDDLPKAQQLQMP